jgi:hypothetical protein
MDHVFRNVKTSSTHVPIKTMVLARTTRLESTSMTGAVTTKHENMPPFVHENYAAHFVDQSSTEGFSRISRRCAADMLSALTVAAEGSKSDKAKPLKGADGGVFEIAPPSR